MLIKVCGMRDPENIRQTAALNIQLMGFIFYSTSKRYTEYVPEALPAHIKKAGVFVNAEGSFIRECVIRYHLDFVQLHGNESSALCGELQQAGISVIKVFSIESEADLEHTALYKGCCDYFLFDTKCTGYGGSGKSFNWSVLSAYKGDTPFLLSGGINPESVTSLTEFTHPKWAGIDVNSGFEIAPGLKDVEKLKNFIQTIKNIRQ